MKNLIEGAPSRRAFLKNAAAIAGTGIIAGCASRTVTTAALPPASAPPPIAVPVIEPVVRTASAPRGVRPELFQRAMAALERHGSRIRQQDRIAIADFSMPSSRLRFHFVDLHNGATRSLLVSHGVGSDPAHTGMLQRFSNEVGSEATCEGAFLASNYYVGKHQLSQRLVGLDPTNNNALDRAIVIHGAWYANPDMIAKHGKLGRSQGCFAVGEADLDQVFTLLGEGRMVYAEKTA
ncbi:murein L,D-transpeptidase catalytic domain family protein [Sphingomonas sp.]|uniref:murein L,D-transpeptidase catalytic domain family protein n=1 Tax=Sphingomonas sp. TaxID=28214 RepID=UPI001ED4B9C7|nr:murein L,D-transpeptidase catalytic domain family protein [Sphingomonas sp.]MBX3595899.1 murein L,D-transpeptidase catalytic domain family protein [Sphingomonas sp.]